MGGWSRWDPETGQSSAGGFSSWRLGKTSGFPVTGTKSRVEEGALQGCEGGEPETKGRGVGILQAKPDGPSTLKTACESGCKRACVRACVCAWRRMWKSIQSVSLEAFSDCDVPLGVMLCLCVYRDRGYKPLSGSQGFCDPTKLGSPGFVCLLVLSDPQGVTFPESPVYSSKPRLHPESPAFSMPRAPPIHHYFVIIYFFLRSLSN